MTNITEQFLTRAEFEQAPASSFPTGRKTFIREPDDTLSLVLQTASGPIAFGTGSGGGGSVSSSGGVGDLLSSTDTSLVEGDVVWAGSFSYIVASPSATDEDLTTAGGVKLYITETAEGWVCPEQFGATPTSDPLGAIKDRILDLDGSVMTMLSDNTEAFNLMGNYGRRKESLKCRLKPLNIYSNVRPWALRNIRHKVLIEGDGASYINPRSSFFNNTPDITAVNNGALTFEGHYVDVDPTTDINLPIGLDSGGLLASAVGNTIVMQSASDMVDFKVGGRFKIFGFCMQGAGSPQIARYFEYGTIKAINGLTLTLTENLEREYDPQWPLIGTRGNAPSGKPEFNGPPQVLSLDRGVDRFIETEHLEIRGVQFLPDPNWTTSLATSSRNGRLTTGGARFVRIENVKTPASVYCFSSERTELVNCSIEGEVEFDKYINSMEVNGGYIGSALQGTGCKEVLLTGGVDVGAMQIISALNRYVIDGAIIRRPHISSVYFATTSGVPYLDIRSVTLGRNPNTFSLFEGLARSQAFTIEANGRLRCSLADLRESGPGHTFLRHVQLGGIIWHNTHPAYRVNRIYQDVIGSADVFFDVTQITPNSISGFTSGASLSVPVYEKIDIGRLQTVDEGQTPLRLMSTVFNVLGFLGELNDGRKSEGISSLQYPRPNNVLAAALHPLSSPFEISSIEVNVERAYSGPTTDARYLIRSGLNELIVAVDLSTEGRRTLEIGGTGAGADVIYYTSPIPATMVGHSTFVPMVYDNEDQQPIFNITFHGSYVRDRINR